MDFKDTFDTLKDKATDLAQAGVAQSKRLAEIAKLKMSNMAEEDAIKKAYIEIGKLYYAEQGATPDGAYAAACEKITASKALIETNNERIAELKRLFIKIYEDNASGRLSDERFDMLSQSYEAEQKQLEAEVVSLRQEIEVQARQSENIEKFIQTAQKYVSIETLDPYALRELVQAIYVEAPDKSSGKRRQNIHIKYDGLGFIPLDKLMKEETA